MAKSIPATAPVDSRAGRVRRLSLSRHKPRQQRFARWSNLIALVVVGGVPYPHVRAVLGSAQHARAALQVCSGSQLHTASSAGWRGRRGAMPGMPVGLRSRLYMHVVALVLTVTAALMTLVQAALPVGGADAHWRATAAEPGAGQVVVLSAPDAPRVSDELVVPYADLSETEQGVFTEYHQLAEGETLGDIAHIYGVTVASLFWSNDLRTATMLRAGSELRIPRVAGVPYVIQPGDTLDSIAGEFGVAPEALTLLHENHLENAAALPVGREIFIPGAAPAYPPEVLESLGGEQGVAAMRAVVTGAVYDDQTNLRSGPGRDYERVASLEAGVRLRPVARHEDWVQVDSDSHGSGWIRADLIALPEDALARLPETDDFPPPPPRWVWPTYGQMTSSFGWRTDPYRSFHDGLDIANRAGTPIRAARTGVVIEAGWCSGFGYCVKINHGGGVTTIYGHMLRKPNVSAGERVEAGDLIGAMGSTYDRAGGGYSTGVHLHFTVKVNGQAVNPLKYLP